MPDFVVYVSSATQPFTVPELKGLLTSARAKNAGRDVTGALLHQDGNFMQVLEGDKGTVEALYQVICRDPRHHSVITMVQGKTAERQFEDWSMAFADLSNTHSELAYGYSDFFTTTDDEPFGPNPTVGQRLMLSFRRTLGSRT